MVHVGCCRTLPVWATSDGHNIYYFSGDEQPLQPHSRTVRFDPPISDLVGQQKSYPDSDTRINRNEAVEMIVHFLFLKDGDIPDVYSRQDKDALEAFGRGCAYFRPEIIQEAGGQVLVIEVNGPLRVGRPGSPERAVRSPSAGVAQPVLDDGFEAARSQSQSPAPSEEPAEDAMTGE